jgi:hypothetical protein
MIAISPRNEDMRKTTLRLPPDQWLRVKELCLELGGITMQDAQVMSLNLLFERLGRPPLDPTAPSLPPTKKPKRGSA